MMEQDVNRFFRRLLLIHEIVRGVAEGLSMIDDWLDLVTVVVV